MRLLTKREACRDLRLSLSTLNQRIAAGEVPVKREPRGRRHRVYVMLDDNPPMDGEAADSELAVVQEGIRGLEAQVECCKVSLRCSGNAMTNWQTRRKRDVSPPHRVTSASVGGGFGRGVTNG